MAFAIAISSAPLCLAEDLLPTHPPESATPYPAYTKMGNLRPESPYRLAASSVMAIVLDAGDGEEVVCTGVLISSSLVLTARHCFYDERTNEPLYIHKLRGLFDYFSTIAPENSVDFERNLADFGKGDLDYAVLRITKPVDIQSRKLPAPGGDPESREDLMVFHVPHGRPLVMDIGCQAFNAPLEGNLLRHRCETGQNSSGAPIFNTSYKLVGIHTRGGMKPDPALFNQGIRLSQIMAASTLVRTELENNEGKGEATRPSPTAVTVASYKMHDGAEFLKIGSDWFLQRKTGSPEISRLGLKTQRGSLGQIVLWSPSTDSMYSIDTQTNVVRHRRVDESVWSLLGVANHDGRP